jgi:hypothetical protein
MFMYLSPILIDVVLVIGVDVADLSPFEFRGVLRRDRGNAG